MLSESFHKIFGKSMKIKLRPFLLKIYERITTKCFTELSLNFRQIGDDFQITARNFRQKHSRKKFLKTACYALINCIRGPTIPGYSFILTVKAYGPNGMRPMHFKCLNKYFPYRPSSRLIRALLYTHTTKSI